MEPQNQSSSQGSSASASTSTSPTMSYTLEATNVDGRQSHFKTSFATEDQAAEAAWRICRQHNLHDHPNDWYVISMPTSASTPTSTSAPMLTAASPISPTAQSATPTSKRKAKTRRRRTNTGASKRRNGDESSMGSSIFSMKSSSSSSLSMLLDSAVPPAPAPAPTPAPVKPRPQIQMKPLYTMTINYSSWDWNPQEEFVKNVKQSITSGHGSFVMVGGNGLQRNSAAGAGQARLEIWRHGNNDIGTMNELTGQPENAVVNNETPSKQAQVTPCKSSSSMSSSSPTTPQTLPTRSTAESFPSPNMLSKSRTMSSERKARQHNQRDSKGTNSTKSTLQESPLKPISAPACDDTVSTSETASTVSSLGGPFDQGTRRVRQVKKLRSSTIQPRVIVFLDEELCAQHLDSRDANNHHGKGGRMPSRRSSSEQSRRRPLEIRRHPYEGMTPKEARPMSKSEHDTPYAYLKGLMQVSMDHSDPLHTANTSSHHGNHFNIGVGDVGRATSDQSNINSNGHAGPIANDNEQSFSNHSKINGNCNGNNNSILDHTFGTGGTSMKPNINTSMNSNINGNSKRNYGRNDKPYKSIRDMLNEMSSQGHKMKEQLYTARLTPPSLYGSVRAGEGNDNRASSSYAAPGSRGFHFEEGMMRLLNCGAMCHGLYGGSSSRPDDQQQEQHFLQMHFRSSSVEGSA